MELRKVKLFAVMAGLMVFIISCTTAQPTDQSDSTPTISFEENPIASQNGLPLTEAEVPRVPLEDSLTALQSGEAIIVDVRSVQAYQASHIAGAISIPLGEIETNPAGLNLDKDQWIITYCT